MPRPWNRRGWGPYCHVMRKPRGEHAVPVERLVYLPPRGAIARSLLYNVAR
jgi:hypothetical protein